MDARKRLGSLNTSIHSPDTRKIARSKPCRVLAYAKRIFCVCRLSTCKRLCYRPPANMQLVQMELRKVDGNPQFHCERRETVFTTDLFLSHMMHTTVNYTVSPARTAPSLLDPLDPPPPPPPLRLSHPGSCSQKVPKSLL